MTARTVIIPWMMSSIHCQNWKKYIRKEKVNMSIFHNAGHMIRKVDVEETKDDTYYYREKYGDYTSATPKDIVCQCAVFSFIMFDVIKHNVCRASLMRVFQQISDYYGFNIQKCHCKTLANIFINNNYKLFTPLLHKETKQNLVKLS